MSRIAQQSLWVLGVVVATLACVPEAPPPVEPAESTGAAEIGVRGGRLVIALRSEPRTLNPVITVDLPSQTVSRRITADLIHINRWTQETEPALAQSWRRSDDATTYTLRLRKPALCLPELRGYCSDSSILQILVLARRIELRSPG